jgi:hypothetical protein
MAQYIAVNDQDFAVLLAKSKEEGTELEQLLHEMIQRMHLSLPTPPPMTTLREFAEKQHREGKLQIPIEETLTPEERKARKRRARLYSGGKSISDMVIEDRGEY